MERSLRAGIAIYNAGAVHTAHDAWEDTWLELPDGSADEQLLHGLIQFTAAIYHAENRNWSGAVGLSKSAREYLSDLPSTYRGVDVSTVRHYLGALEADPERIERASPPALVYKGQPLSAADLTIDAITTAAAVLAADYDQYDETVIDEAIEYAREEAPGTQTQFIGLLTAFVDDHAHRDLLYTRLEAQVDRRRQKQQDVAGLFDERDNT
jgi:hypothetical protein